MPTLLAACFVVSGATSLILQVVWVRKLVEVFGSSTLAISTVLATFMGGLALGAWLGGRLADRLIERGSVRRDPLFFYAAAEATVGVVALIMLPLIDGFRGANAWLWVHLGEQPAALSIARFAITAVALGLPTTAMGATLPLLSRRITSSKNDLDALGRRIGALYAANTTGAVIGATSAGFWLIPAIGVSSTNRVAAFGAIALAIAVAIATWRLARTPSAPEPDPVPDEDPVPAPEPDPDPAPTQRPRIDGRTLALTAYALSGAVAMALEVFYSRAFAVILGSSIHSFTLVLAVFLVGIAVGSAIAAPLAARTRHPHVLLAVILLLVSLAITGAHALIDDLPATMLALLEGTRLDISTLLWTDTFLAGLVIFPAALGLGAVMPVAMRAYVGELGAVGRDVGRAYAANTVGAIAGALLAGFLVLPAFGLETGIRAAALIDAAVALGLLWFAARRRRALALVPAVAVIAIALLPGRWNRSDFTAGMFRTYLARSFIEAGGLFQREVVFYADGSSTTVSVEHLGVDRWVLKNNGKVEASNKQDMPTQILVGLLPVLLHGGDDQSVFVIGYGSGVTVGAIAQAPSVSSLDVVELEPAVYEAADRYFSEFNHRPQDDPKVRRWVGDGRNVLLAGGRRYDVVVSEPSNPWIAGVASLFSRDFYELAKRHLADDGVFCQWAQLYELSARNVKMIYRTFAESFPYVYAFSPSDESTDTILVGSLRPIDLDVERLAARMRASEPLVKELERAQIDRAETLLGGAFMLPPDLPGFTAGAEINTDDLPRLEYLAPRDLLASSRGNQFARIVRGDHWPYGRLDGALTGMGSGAARAGREIALARALLGYGRIAAARRWLDRARSDAVPAELADAEQLFALAEPRDFLDPELPIAFGGVPLATLAPEQFAVPREEGLSAVEAVRAGMKSLAEGRWQAAWSSLAGLPDRADTPEGRDLTLLMAYAAYKAVELERAGRLLEKLAEDAAYVARRPTVTYYRGRVHYGLGLFRDGLAELDGLRRSHPAIVKEAIDTRLGQSMVE